MQKPWNMVGGGGRGGRSLTQDWLHSIEWKTFLGEITSPKVDSNDIIYERKDKFEVELQKATWTFRHKTFLAIFQPTSSMLLEDQSTCLFDNIWEKGKYFVADHERAINNLPRTCFFPQPTILNQAKWDPRLNQIKQNIPNIRGVQNYKYALNFLAVHLSSILLTASHNQWRFDFRVFAAS